MPAKQGLLTNQNLQGAQVEFNGQKMGIQEAAAQAAIQRGLENGTLRNSADAARAGRDAARAARDALSSPEANKARRDKNELEALRDKEKNRPKQMSERDKDRKKLLEDLEKARDEREKEAKAIKDVPKNIQKTAKAAEDMLKLMKDKLGLK